VGGAWGADSFDTLKESRVWEAVKCATLPALLGTHGVQRLDVFVVDAEGYDARILAQLVNPPTRLPQTLNPKLQPFNLNP